MTPLFELRELACRRGSIDALRGVSLSFPPGELTGLIGLNGAGKSTLLAIMSGLLRGYSGACRLESEEVARIPPRPLGRRVSFLPQLVSGSLPFRCEQVALMGRYPHGDAWFESPEDHVAVRDAMAAAGCLHLRDRLFDTLSGGERQRVLLAAALAQQPRALLLDEPGTFLDLPHQAQIFRALRDRSRAGALCIAATHELNLAGAFCDRIVLLDSGRLAADGSPAAVFESAEFARIFGPDIRAARDASGRPMVLFES
jgi:iron complex transport system ATP-binding protein